MHVLWSYVIGHLLNIFWASFKASIIWTLFEHDVDIICTSFGHRLDTIWTPFGYHLDMIWVSFGHHLDIIFGASIFTGNPKIRFRYFILRPNMFLKVPRKPKLQFRPFSFDWGKKQSDREVRFFQNYKFYYIVVVLFCGETGHSSTPPGSADAQHVILIPRHRSELS